MKTRFLLAMPFPKVARAASRADNEGNLVEAVKTVRQNGVDLIHIRRAYNFLHGMP